MSFLQGRFSFLLVCVIQLITQTLLQGAGVDAATLDSLNTQTSCLAAPAFLDESSKSFALKAPSLTSLDVLEETPPLTPTNNEGISRRALSVALFPLDCLRHMALSVLRAPLLFLAATSAFVSETPAHAHHPKHPMITSHADSTSRSQTQEHRYISLGLSSSWNITTCKGRALNLDEIGRSQTLKKRCRVASCMPRVAYSAMCNNPKKRYELRRNGMLSAICDDITCAPYSIGLGLTNRAHRTLDSCTHKACQSLGHPHTGRFACTAFARGVSTRQQIDRAILEAEQCFESFCQENAKTRCPKEPSMWQRLFGLSPCNESLCTERFVPDEMKEVSPGVFKTLEQLGEYAIQNCKEVSAYKRHCH